MSVPVVLPVRVPLTSGERISGLTAVVVARSVLIVTRGRPAPLAGALRVLRHGITDQAESAESIARVYRVRAIIETVSFRCGGHHGCLLRSVAVAVLSRWHGHRVTWRVGVHSPPPSSHAWIEVNGHPIGEPFDPYLLYTPIITV